MKRGVTLTKDNLIKRNWKGCAKCCFCNSNETIQHLFFDCHVARLVWNIISIAFGIQTPSSVSNMLGPWRRSFPRKQRKTILIGVTALCWAIWISGNDVIFKNSTHNSSLQVIFTGTYYWTRSWSLLSKEEERLI